MTDAMFKHAQIHTQTPDVCRQSESQLGMQRQIQEATNIVHPDRFIRELAQPDGDWQIPEFGSSGRIRTYDQSVNSRPLYH
jgi:hypothetical protein